MLPKKVSFILPGNFLFGHAVWQQSPAWKKGRNLVCFCWARAQSVSCLDKPDQSWMPTWLAVFQLAALQCTVRDG